RVKEESDDFYTRVSERLRHKHRAVMIFDHERIVLEAFPSVYKVKCMNHTRYISPLDINEMAPGNVSLAIVSNMRNKNAVNPLQPKTSLLVLSQIHDLVKSLNPPLAEVYVKNPIYEEIIVHFNVKLHPGFDAGFYGNQLNQDIKKFLSPWAYEETDIVFGISIHGSVILNFIEERPYVDFVTCFSMDQVVGGVIIKGIEEAIPSTGASILTSAVTHDIFILETEDCECDDNIVTTHVHNDDCTCDHEITPPRIQSGVGGTQIGSNFIVGNGGPFGNDGVGFMEIDKDFEVE
ncbi:MAG TPA: baseplate J/gp47 family protein, partial [Flavobacteriales bacterium]|nr:baseplate J/gp47 family protein [Flavobacteriales bacterium]